MAFRYINPGYAELLQSAGNYSSVTNSTYNPINGVSIQGASNYGCFIQLDTVPKELYGSCTLFFTGNAYFNHYAGYGIMFRNGTDNHFSGVSFENDSGYSSWLAVKMRYDHTKASSYPTFTNYYYDNTLKKCWFHIRMKTSESDEIGLTEISIDGGKTIYREEFSTVASFYGDKIYINIPNRDSYLSNLILSDEYISPKEQVIVLPTATTITDMTAGASGIYIANAENQTLLQTVDVSTLIENYGASSAVTGIALVGNPAYRTSTGLASLTSLSRAGTSTIEHGTCVLSDNTTGTILDGWTTENLTISDFQDMQFGWKAGT